jgi:uncharacterized protein YqjF (DUF2071 family)
MPDHLRERQKNDVMDEGKYYFTLLPFELENHRHCFCL